MEIDDKREAVDAMQAAEQALTHAIELAECTRFGSQVVGPLKNARCDLRYALATADGRN
jgi:hypothetical protein